jgi:catechol 2,3-dioxygenase-like lactoylglutathione lyase family enzyme
MIVPNLAVADLPRAVAFWCDVLGFSVQFVVGPDATMQDGPEGGVFASLEKDGQQIMLQTAESLGAELPEAVAGSAPRGTHYLRGWDPDPVLGRLPAEHLVKPPFRQWYGMREAYIRDPDGHILCLGVADGPAPE